jgi:hypothetical protein
LCSLPGHLCPLPYEAGRKFRDFSVARQWKNRLASARLRPAVTIVLTRELMLTQMDS